LLDGIFVKNAQTLKNLKSGLDSIHLPRIFDSKAAPLIRLMHQLEKTQWLPAETMSKHQHKQLVALAKHTDKYSVHFHKRLAAANLTPDDLSTPEGLRKLPVMSRRELQSAEDDIFCSMIPQAHAPVNVHCSSGSTGEPVNVRRTAINNLFYQATNLRENLWQQRDFTGTYAVIRANMPDGIKEMKNWGKPYSWFFKTGPVYLKNVTTDIDEQVEWLRQIDPDYLLTYPNNLTALLQKFEQRGLKLPRLREIRSVAETLSDELRDYARKVFNVEIADTYSSEEVGTIALQCPVSGLYHIMSECLIVEILDEKDNPCWPGQIGRVVVTDLYNFATPLIRYDLNDYAKVSEDCSCGRGLKTLKRIIGRSRNMVLLPDGRKHWLFFGSARYREIAPIRQRQLIQRSRETIEVRLVVDAPLNMEQKKRFTELMHESLGYPFELKFVYFDEKIPRSKSGKYEEFICEV
jgi:phenylacetate-CoA ligase